MTREIKNVSEMWDEIIERMEADPTKPGSEARIAKWNELKSWYRSNYPEYAWSFDVEGFITDSNGNVTEIIPMEV